VEYNGHWKTDGRRDYHDEQHLKIYARMIQSPRSLTTCSRGAGRPVARQKKCKLRPDLAAVVPGPGKEPGAQQNCLPRSELCRWIGYRGSHSVRRSRSAPDGYRGRDADRLIDRGGGTSAVCAVAAGSIGLVLSRKFWQRHLYAREVGARRWALRSGGYGASP
jgi:hypothetical protein